MVVGIPTYPDPSAGRELSTGNRLLPAPRQKGFLTAPYRGQTSFFGLVSSKVSALGMRRAPLTSQTSRVPREARLGLSPCSPLPWEGLYLPSCCGVGVDRKAARAAFRL